MPTHRSVTIGNERERKQNAERTSKIQRERSGEINDRLAKEVI